MNRGMLGFPGDAHRGFASIAKVFSEERRLVAAMNPQYLSWPNLFADIDAAAYIVSWSCHAKAYANQKGEFYLTTDHGSNYVKVGDTGTYSNECLPQLFAFLTADGSGIALSAIPFFGTWGSSPSVYVGGPLGAVAYPSMARAKLTGMQVKMTDCDEISYRLNVWALTE